MDVSTNTSHLIGRLDATAARGMQRVIPLIYLQDMLYRKKQQETDSLVATCGNIGGYELVTNGVSLQGTSWGVVPLEREVVVFLEVTKTITMGNGSE